MFIINVLPKHGDIGALVSTVPPCSYVCMFSCFPNQGALEKSARAAGLASNAAEKYAADVVKIIPGNNCHI